jgi:hypothetical protein
MIQMVMDQRLFRFPNSALHGVKLLGEIKAGSAILDHADDLVQMALGPAQALDDLGM